MPPITLAQVRQSSFPETLGFCIEDIPRIAAAVNGAQERLILAGGETGWWGGWQPARFPITQANPYITLPRQFNRIINMAVCDQGLPINNVFFELLPHNIGIPTGCCRLPDWCGKDIEGYERGNYPTSVDVTASNQYLRVYVTDSRDIGKRMLISGLDQNGLPFYSSDGTLNPLGFYLTFADPFVQSSFIVTQIQTVQKDYTFGDIVLQQVDATTGEAVNLARYGPNEINPSYRRYYINRLPSLCCGPNNLPANVSISAVCKLQYFPVIQDTDWLIIQCIPALEEEAQANRYSRMDSPNALNLAAGHHRAAIRHLQNQLRHEEGEQSPAVNVDIFPGAPLEAQGIGTLV